MAEITGFDCPVGKSSPSIDLLLLGASVRSMACWFVKAGYSPLGLDLFADRDLGKLCPARKIDRESWPDGLIEACEPYPGIPIVYSGGLENTPRLLDKLAKTHPILGNRTKSLSQARDPARWGPILEDAGFTIPGWVPGPKGELITNGIDGPVVPEGDWLIKPYRSAGGLNIRETFPGQNIPQGYFAQTRVRGTGVSLSLALGVGEPRFFLGAYEMPNIPALAAPPFAYRGSVVFRGLTHLMSAQGKALGKVLKEKMGLRGLVGIDAISVSGNLRVIEINPRPTASMELADPFGGATLAQWHVAAFLGASHEMNHTLPRERPLAKAIWYSDRDFVFPKEWEPGEVERSLEIRLADIPRPLEAMGKGEPILTLILEESDPGRMIERIEAAISVLKKGLFPNQVPG